MVSSTIRVLVLILFQSLALRGFVLEGIAFCFLYVLAILTLPLDMNRSLQMIIAFFIGLSVDLFYDVVGIHAFASVLTAYLKPIWTTSLTPGGGYDLGQKIGAKHMGFSWFSVYSLPLILIHSLALFLLEASDLSLFWLQLLKSAATSVFTYLVILIVEYLFYPVR